MILTTLQQQICNELQNGLMICDRPFAFLAKKLGVDETDILQAARQLKADGIIRRFGAMINYKALGKSTTLVTAHVPQNKIDTVVKAVNSLKDVSHNYLRDHHYNLWFTLQGDSNKQIEQAIKKLHERFDIDFHSLPAKRFFKLDVRFDAGSGSIISTQKVTSITAKDKIATLTEQEISILFKLQNQLELVEKPFDFLTDKNFEISDVLETVKSLISKGAIRRVAAVVDHRKLGFNANVLFVCRVNSEKVPEVAGALVSSEMVTHCYERKTFQGWDYNLFAMMHSRKMEQILKMLNEFVEEYHIDSFELLSTVSELKKEPVVYSLQRG